MPGQNGIASVGRGDGDQDGGQSLSVTTGSVAVAVAEPDVVLSGATVTELVEVLQDLEDQLAENIAATVNN